MLEAATLARYNRSMHKPYCPTREGIAAATAAIRSKWTPAEHDRRRRFVHVLRKNRRGEWYIRMVIARPGEGRRVVALASILDALERP